MQKTNDTLNTLLNALGPQRGMRRTLDMLGRVVIPKDFREYLHLNVGDTVEIKMYDGAILIVKPDARE